MDSSKYYGLYKKAMINDLSESELKEFAEESMICRRLGLRAEEYIHALTKDLEIVLSGWKPDETRVS